MEDDGQFVYLLLVGTFYAYLVYFMLTWYFFPFWYVEPRKIWQPWSGP
jgi:hypothetical protein